MYSKATTANALRHRPPTRIAAVCVLLLSSMHAAQTQDAPPLESGACIPVGTAGQCGPLATHAIVSTPIGAAFVFGKAQPDLFVATGRFGRNTGLFLYPWAATTPDGIPVFGTPIPLQFPLAQKHRGKNYPPTGVIFQTQDGAIHGLWRDGKKLLLTTFDPGTRSFAEERTLTIPGLPRSPESIGLLQNPGGSVEILFGIADGVRYTPDDFSGRDPRYRPYDGAGVWRGGFPYVSLYALTLPGLQQDPAEHPRRVSATEHEVRSGYHRIIAVKLGPGHERGIVTGSHYGGIHFYHNAAATGLELAPRVHLTGADGNAHRHPTVGASPLAYPNPETGLSDLVAGGEGGLYHYRFIGNFTGEGKPIYDAPRYVLEEHAALYAGSLPVPNAVDWDADGDLDLVCGNSEGLVLFFCNTGSNAAPAFAPGIPLRAGGQVIHIQPGYRDDIQGPGEARWGYTCPTVADWNADGLPDLLMSDSTAKHTVFLNRGTAHQPELAPGHPLYCDGLDLHGTWRVKPAAAPMGPRMAYVTLDDDDQFHRYWRVDDYNLEDGGKLLLDTGAPIGANFLSAGGTGRLKLNLYDWDGDGTLDLIVGTPRHGSVPNAEHGLPQSLGLPGSAVLLLRNLGSNETPRFAFPQFLAFRGAPLFLGQHACAPAIADFGGPAGPDLIVGEESGRLLFYRRTDLSVQDAGQ